MRHIILSPHHDDALFSLGETMMQMIGRDEEVTVATPMAGVPADHWGQTKALRLDAEHVEVMKAMRAHMVNGPWLDDCYPAEAHDGLDRWIGNLMNEADVVWVPAGIHHPDHITVAAAAQGAYQACRRRPKLVVYEELPYRVLYPEEAVRVVELWRLGHDAQMVGHSHHLAAKRDLCRRYESQMGEDIERCLYVPERAWRLT